MRDQTLKNYEEDNLGNCQKRICVEALDFDWIFQNNNISVMLDLMATRANRKLLVKRSFKVIIELLWA